MKAYRIEGTFPMGINKEQKFVRELACKDEKEARETLLSELGSEHGIKRRAITIKEIKQIRPEDITSPVVKNQLGVK